MTDFIQLLLFILPAYVANAVPVLLGGGLYLDLGAKLSDGERIFGNGKTIRGFVAGVAAGTTAAGLLAIYFPSSLFSSPSQQFFGGMALSFGTMAGDAFGSFLKRRSKVQPGKPFVLDQLMFLIIALLSVIPFVSEKQLVYEPVPLLFLFVLTYFLHGGTNWFANKLGLKSVPW